MAILGARFVGNQVGNENLSKKNRNQKIHFFFFEEISDKKK